MLFVDIASEFFNPLSASKSAKLCWKQEVFPASTEESVSRGNEEGQCEENVLLIQSREPLRKL